MTDWGQLYRDNAAAVRALALDLSVERLETPVPATPEWTVRLLLAHLAGTAADATSGRMDNAPGPEWTGRHVAERSHLPVAELMAELESTQDAVTAEADKVERPAIVWNLVVHHADLHEALGLPALPDHFWRPVLKSVAPRMLGSLPATVRAGTDNWGAGGGTVDVSAYELFRALFSRRSRSQVAAWAAPTLSDEQLSEIGVFGPRDDDQPMPSGSPQ